jgi:gamma-glutamylcysteine synthetase
LEYAGKEDIAHLHQRLSGDDEFPIHTEAAGVIEYASSPYDLTDLDDLIVKANHAEGRINEAAQESGLKVLPCAVPPFTTLAEAEEKMIGRERVVDMVESVRTGLPLDALKVGFLTASVQVSLTYSGPQDLYRTLYLGHALSPVLIALFASDTGRADGQAYFEHIRSVFYRAYPTHESGIPSYLQDVTDGEALIRRHIEEICNAPLLYYYDRDGVMHTGSLSCTFNSLASDNLQTERNFALAESFLYPDIKFKPLPEGGRRLEFRTPDSGPAQMAAATALIGGVIGTERSAIALETILKDFGFKGSFREDYSLLSQSRASAVENTGNLDKMSFGSKTMRDFLARHQGIGSRKFRRRQSFGPCDCAVFVTLILFL